MRSLSAILVALVLVVPSVAMADDLFPPPWRGQPGTTWGEWDFLTPNPFPLPEAGFESPMSETSISTSSTAVPPASTMAMRAAALPS